MICVSFFYSPVFFGKAGESLYGRSVGLAEALPTKHLLVPGESPPGTVLHITSGGGPVLESRVLDTTNCQKRKLLSSSSSRLLLALVFGLLGIVRGKPINAACPGPSDVFTLYLRPQLATQEVLAAFLVVVVRPSSFVAKGGPIHPRAFAAAVPVAQVPEAP